MVQRTKLQNLERETQRDKCSLARARTMASSHLHNLSFAFQLLTFSNKWYILDLSDLCLPRQTNKISLHNATAI